MLLDADDSQLVLVDYQSRLMPSIFESSVVLSSLALPCVLLGMFLVATVLGRSLATLMAGCFAFGAGVWLLHGAVTPEHRSMVLPGLMLWPLMTPAYAALIWWGRASPQPPRWFAAGLAILAVALALVGGWVAYLLIA